MKNKGYKLFIVQSYVKARNAPEALRLFRKNAPDDVYVSNDWKEGKNNQLASAIGFESYPPQSDDND